MDASVPPGCLPCLLCKGAISLRGGNLSKVRSHLETVHDSLYSADILIAVMFLGQHEKEVILEKVVPRIKNVLGGVKNSEQNKLRIEELLEERDTNDEPSMEVDIFAEEECETIEDEEESQGFVDVEEISVELEKFKKGSQEFQGADGKIYADCDNCGKTLTKQSLAKHKRLVRCNPQKPIPSKVEEKEKEVERNLPNGSSKCKECDSVNTNMRRHMRRVHGDLKSKSTDTDTGEEEVKKVSEFVSSTDASIIDMKNKLESKDDKEDVKASDEVGNKCSRCPKTFAHKKNVARHEKICVSSQ